MDVSAWQLKWLLRFYPPLFFQRIWVVNIAPDFSGLTIKVAKSIFNTNYNSAIFGGTIFSAADVCYPVLLYPFFRRKGYDIAVWSRSAQIHFIKKITDKIIFSVNLSSKDLEQMEVQLTEKGKVMTAYPVNIYNCNGEICVTVKCEVFIRNRKFTQPKREESLYK